MAISNLTTPLPWLLGSVALAILATNLTWVAVRRQARRVTALRPLGWLAVSLFHLLPPVIAWVNGALSPYWLGVAGLDWVASLATGAPLVAFVTGGLLFGWLVYRRSLSQAPPLAARLSRAGQILRSVVDAALLQWHWAFYRALAIAVLAAGSGPLRVSEQAAYWGAWLAVGAVAAEATLNPFLRQRLGRPVEREAVLRQAALALGTTALFLLTRNFYLGLVLHLGVEALITGWFPLPVPGPERA